MKIKDLKYVNRLLTESRIDDVKLKYGDDAPGFNTIPDIMIEKFSENDPSGNNKYLEWMVKEFIHSKNLGMMSRNIIEMVIDFHKNVDRLDVKDIYQYTWRSLGNKLKEIGPSKKEIKRIEKSGSVKLYEDNEYLIVTPLTKEASCHYGSSTRWCTAAKTNNAFEGYNEDGTLIYIIDKKGDVGKFNKVAMYVPDTVLENGLIRYLDKWDIQLYDSEDNELEDGLWVDFIFKSNEVRKNKMQKSMVDYLNNKSFEDSLNESMDFDWVNNIEESPNYHGYPQGVVYLKSHDEIEEFFEILGNRDMLKAKELLDYQKNYHHALEDVRDGFESPDWDGYDDWVPAISSSFFISKKDPTKYLIGYWDYDIDEGSVIDWLHDDGSEEYIIDTENWKIYENISQFRNLFKNLNPDSLHKTKSGKPIKVGDKVKVIDPDSNQYGEVLEVEHLVGGDGYEKHGGAFQTIEYDTTYFAGYEVEHFNDLNESNDFEWVEDIEADKVSKKYDKNAHDVNIVDEGITLGQFINKYYGPDNVLTIII